MVHWGRLVPASVAGVLMFSIAVASQTGQAERSQAPMPVPSPADYRSVEASWEPPWWSKYRGAEVPPMPSGHIAAVMPGDPGTNAGEMPHVSGRLQ